MKKIRILSKSAERPEGLRHLKMCGNPLALTGRSPLKGRRDYDHEAVKGSCVKLSRSPLKGRRDYDTKPVKDHRALIRSKSAERPEGLRLVDARRAQVLDDGRSPLKGRRDYDLLVGHTKAPGMSVEVR